MVWSECCEFLLQERCAEAPDTAARRGHWNLRITPRLIFFYLKNPHCCGLVCLYRYSPWVRGSLRSEPQPEVFGPTSCRMWGEWLHHISLRWTHSVVCVVENRVFGQWRAWWDIFGVRWLSYLLLYFSVVELLNELLAAQWVVGQVGFESLDGRQRPLTGLLRLSWHWMSMLKEKYTVSVLCLQCLTLYSSEWREVSGSPLPSAWKHCSRHWHTKQQKAP